MPAMGFGNILKEMQEFAKAASSFSSNENRMIDRYPGEWVAVVPSGQEFHGASYDSVLQQMMNMTEIAP